MEFLENDSLAEEGCIKETLSPQFYLWLGLISYRLW
jgi:hypothetical protein